MRFFLTPFFYVLFLTLLLSQGSALHAAKKCELNFAQISQLGKELKAKNYYERLGLDIHATQDDIKKAYRKLASRYHTDGMDILHLSDEEKLVYSKPFQEIKEAYETLGNPQKRKLYDNSEPSLFRSTTPRPAQGIDPKQLEELVQLKTVLGENFVQDNFALYTQKISKYGSTQGYIEFFATAYPYNSNWKNNFTAKKFFDYFQKYYEKDFERKAPTARQYQNLQKILRRNPQENPKRKEYWQKMFAAADTPSESIQLGVDSFLSRTNEDGVSSMSAIIAKRFQLTETEVAARFLNQVFEKITRAPPKWDQKWTDKIAIASIAKLVGSRKGISALIQFKRKYHLSKDLDQYLQTVFRRLREHYPGFLQADENLTSLELFDFHKIADGQPLYPRSSP